MGDISCRFFAKLFHCGAFAALSSRMLFFAHMRLVVAMALSPSHVPLNCYYEVKFRIAIKREDEEGRKGENLCVRRMNRQNVE